MCNETTNDQNRPLESIDFDDPKPMQLMDREKPDDSSSMQKLLDGVGDLLITRLTPMKPGRFDGTGSLESFLTQY